MELPARSVVLDPPLPRSPSRRLSPEQAPAWLTRTKAAFTHRPLAELAQHLLRSGAAEGGDPARTYVEELLRAFVTGRDEGLELPAAFSRFEDVRRHCVHASLMRVATGAERT